MHQYLHRAPSLRDVRGQCVEHFLPPTLVGGIDVEVLGPAAHLFDAFPDILYMGHPRLAVEMDAGDVIPRARELLGAGLAEPARRSEYQGPTRRGRCLDHASPLSVAKNLV